MSEQEKQIEDGGFAFPRDDDVSIGDYRRSGMTLRDYFAAKAMPVVYDDESSPSTTARRAYAIADAMLIARRLPTPC